MFRRTAFATLTSLALSTASFAANADILFSNLGTAAPPASVGGHVMTPFDQSAQAAIPDLTPGVSLVPGSPIGGSLSLGLGSESYKGSIGNGWATWSHGYTGAMYFVGYVTESTLTLPANTKAFYFYVEPNTFDVFTITATSNTGVASGPVAVNGASGANGFAFYGTAGETITSITITADEGADGFAVGEFGISGNSTTCASEGYKGIKLIWCQNICEKGLTGQKLATWIHRWITQYHDLPYCAVEEEEEEQQQE